MQAASKTSGIRRAVGGSIALLLLPGIAACTSSDDTTSTATPDDSVAPEQSAPAATPSDSPVLGLACSQAGTMLDIETPNDEGWQTP
jgi:hypothetical protein